MGWEGAEGHEREDEENYPCNDIKGIQSDNNRCYKNIENLHRSEFILPAEWVEEHQGNRRNGHARHEDGRYSPYPLFLQCGEVERPWDAVNGPENCCYADRKYG